MSGCFSTPVSQTKATNSLSATRNPETSNLENPLNSLFSLTDLFCVWVQGCEDGAFIFVIQGLRGSWVDDSVILLIREEEEEEEEEAMNLNGEELAGPPGPKVTRLVYFVGAAFICVIGINKWREFQNKPVVLPQDPKLQQQSQK